jgi:hypothetical protein
MAELKKNQMTDVPELMAASSISGANIIPEDFDPLGQVD